MVIDVMGSPTRRFRIGEWIVCPRSNTATRGATEVVLRSKAMDVLVVLATNAGQVVLREELVEKVWGGNQFVSGNGIKSAIWQIRQALGDADAETGLIETLHKRGYRLRTVVEFLDESGAAEVTPKSGETDASVNVSQVDVEISAAPAVPLAIDDHAIDAATHPPVLRATRAWAWPLAALGGLMVILLAWLALSPPRVQPESAPPTASTASIIPVVTGIAGIGGFAYSSANDLVAYAVKTRQSLPAEIHVRGMSDGASPRLLLSSPGTFSSLAWSPNGQSLAFLHTDLQGRCALEVMTLAGGDVRKLGGCAAVIFGNHLVWADAGKSLVVGRTAKAGRVRLVVVDAETGASRWLERFPEQGSTADGDAEFDSLALAADASGSSFLIRRGARAADARQLVLLDLDGTERLVGEYPFTMKEGCWWGNDHVILGLSNGPSARQLFDLDLTTGTWEALGLTGGSPQRSKDGSLLFFTAHAVLALSEMDVSAPMGPIARLLQAGTVEEVLPAGYGANGAKLFMSQKSGHLEVYEYRRGGEVSAMTNLRTMVFNPVQSRDGKATLFAGHCTARTNQLCLMRAPGSVIEALLDVPKFITSVAWLEEGKRAMFSLEGGSVGIVDIDSRQVDWIADVDSIQALPAGTGSDFYWTSANRPGIWRRDVEAASDTLVVPEFPADSLLWTTVNGQLYYVQKRINSPTSLYRRDATGSERTVAVLEPRVNMIPNTNIAMNPDETRMLFAENVASTAGIYRASPVQPSTPSQLSR